VQDTFPSSSAPGPVFWIVCAAFIVFEIASMWRVFEKAGKPGWACIIPIYNVVVLCQIAGKPGWWVLLFLIPLVNLVVSIIVKHNISKNFGHDVGFTLGLIFLGFIFYPILAWGDSEYQPPVPEYQSA
jgi:uncharacterized membrane protein YhaH (DUF805 family)